MNRMFSLCWILAGMVGLLAAGVAGASPCIEAARQAARDAGLPQEVMIALSRVETGRGPDRATWPWALNHRGTAHYPADRAAALRQMRAWADAGDHQFDVGCFQINMRWHGDQFATLEHMIDPHENAAYAARFLSQLFAETGSWDTSIGYYHSRTPDLAHAYRQRVFAVMEAPPPATPTTAPHAPATVEWRAMPRSGSQRRGSLFPLS